MQQTPLIPAKAEIQEPWSVALGPRFRGDERKVWLRLLWTKPSRICGSRIPTMQQTPFIPAKAGIQGPRSVALGPRFRIPLRNSSWNERDSVIPSSR